MFRNFFSYFIPFFFIIYSFFFLYIYFFFFLSLCLEIFSVIFSFFFFFPFTSFFFFFSSYIYLREEILFLPAFVVLFVCLSVNNFTQPDENCWSYFHENFTTDVHWDKEVFHYNLEVIRREQTLPYVPCCQAEIPALYWVPLWFFSVSMLGNFFSNFFPYFFPLFFYFL